VATESADTSYEEYLAQSSVAEALLDTAIGVGRQRGGGAESVPADLPRRLRLLGDALRRLAKAAAERRETLFADLPPNRRTREYKFAFARDGALSGHLDTLEKSADALAEMLWTIRNECWSLNFAGECLAGQIAALPDPAFAVEAVRLRDRSQLPFGNAEILRVGPGRAMEFSRWQVPYPYCQDKSAIDALEAFADEVRPTYELLKSMRDPLFNQARVLAIAWRDNFERH
jgi:hypothetical protein